ncbi:hypothetical protein [Fictibacillus phosphorivorans]|uniref:hypothetical protein n=1 Tax=Fictibacillus phosphorivorans TaxID=1221500 RepID=UPI0035E921D8
MGKFNYGVVIALASLFYLILEDLGYKIDPTRWETYITLIVGLLISFGIIRNPSKADGDK